MRGRGNKIYRGLIAICEKREHDGAYHGNGHHLAQELTTSVLIELLPRNQRLLFDALTQTHQTAKQLSEKTGFDTKTVSSMLRAINKEGTLVTSKKEGPKIFSYKKAYSTGN